MILWFRFSLNECDARYETLLLTLCASFSPSFTRTSSEFHLYLQGNQTLLYEFSQTLLHYLPLSYHYSFIEVKETSIQPSSDTKLPYTPHPLDYLVNEFSNQPFFPSRFAKKQSPLEINHLSCLSNESFNTLFTSFIDNFLANIPTSLALYTGQIHLLPLTTPSFSKNATIVLKDLATIGLFTTASSSELLALGSWEKPTIKLSFKPSFIKDYHAFNMKIVRCSLPYDPLLILICQELEKRYDDFLGFIIEPISTPHSNHIQRQCDTLISQEEIIITSRKIFSVSSLCETPCYPNTHDTLILNLSTQTASYLSFNHYGQIKQTHFTFETQLEKLLANLRLSETGERLYHNYHKQFPHSVSQTSHSLISSNLIDIFSPIIKLLSLPSLESLLFYAGQCYHKKGPRIDFNISNMSFNPLAPLSSIMSYQLAGIDLPTLCYGIIESFCEFLASLINDTCEIYLLTTLSLRGDFFTYPLIASKIVHSLPHLSFA